VPIVRLISSAGAILQSSLVRDFQGWPSNLWKGVKGRLKDMMDYAGWRKIIVGTPTPYSLQWYRILNIWTNIPEQISSVSTFNHAETGERTDHKKQKRDLPLFSGIMPSQTRRSRKRELSASTSMFSPFVTPIWPLTQIKVLTMSRIVLLSSRSTDEEPSAIW